MRQFKRVLKRDKRTDAVYMVKVHVTEERRNERKRLVKTSD